MPCDTVLLPSETLADRSRKIAEVTSSIVVAIAAGRVQLKVSASGMVTLVLPPGFDRAGMTDACIVRRMSTENSFEWRKALVAAETKAGRKANLAISGQGTLHTHDGGLTWGRH